MAQTDNGKKPWVEYNWLSQNAGIKVSNICFGAATMGNTDQGQMFNVPGNTDEAQSHELLDRYVELGGNFVDTANVYSQGESEQILGSWLSKRDRSSIVLATKVRFSLENSPQNMRGLSRVSILENLDRSLKRLKTDYVDIYYAHAWDAGVKLEETLRTFNDVVRSGKARYIGLSNVTGAQLQKIIDYNKFLGFDQSVVLEPEYNLLERSIEYEIVPTAKEGGLGLVPYSPLKGGLLTGKFKRDDKDVVNTLKGTRLGWTAEKPDSRTHSVCPNVENYRENEDFWALQNTMETIGKKYGKSVSQVAIRWVLQQQPVSSVIIGAKTIAQLEENMAAGAGWSLTQDEVDKLTQASQFAYPNPGYPFGFINRLNADRVRPL